MKCKSCATAVDACEVCGRPAVMRQAPAGIVVQLPGTSRPIPIALAKPTKPGTRRNPRQLKLSPERTTVVSTIHFDAERLEQLNYAAMRAGVRLSHVVDQACREFIEKYNLAAPARG